MSQWLSSIWRGSSNTRDLKNDTITTSVCGGWTNKNKGERQPCWEEAHTGRIKATDCWVSGTVKEVSVEGWLVQVTGWQTRVLLPPGWISLRLYSFGNRTEDDSRSFFAASNLQPENQDAFSFLLTERSTFGWRHLTYVAILSLNAKHTNWKTYTVRVWMCNIYLWFASHFRQIWIKHCSIIGACRGSVELRSSQFNPTTGGNYIYITVSFFWAKIKENILNIRKTTEAV